MIITQDMKEHRQIEARNNESLFDTTAFKLDYY
jgi:hypothetical protein